jgi:hypothetical protein
MEVARVHLAVAFGLMPPRAMLIFMKHTSRIWNGLAFPGSTSQRRPTYVSSSMRSFCNKHGHFGGQLTNQVVDQRASLKLPITVAHPHRDINGLSTRAAPALFVPCQGRPDFGKVEKWQG